MRSAKSEQMMIVMPKPGEPAAGDGAEFEFGEPERGAPVIQDGAADGKADSRRDEREKTCEKDGLMLAGRERLFGRGAVCDRV